MSEARLPRRGCAAQCLSMARIHIRMTLPRHPPQKGELDVNGIDPHTMSTLRVLYLNARQAHPDASGNLEGTRFWEKCREIDVSTRVVAAHFDKDVAKFSMADAPQIDEGFARLARVLRARGGSSG